MEADWSVEIGPDLPCIDASWAGFVDLRTHPHRVAELEEAARQPALHEALTLLNAADSPVFTTKCDTWTLAATEMDPDEFNATLETAHTGFASYIDIVERNRAHFASFAFHEQRMRDLTNRLRETPVRQARVDLVLRAAVFEDREGYGITLYAAGCGTDEAGAYSCWERGLAATVAATIAAAERPAATGE